MKQMIDANVSVTGQEVEAQVSELELERKQKQAAKVIAIEKDSDFDRGFDAKLCNLDSIFFCTTAYLNLIAMEDVWKHCMKQGVDITREKMK